MRLALLSILSLVPLAAQTVIDVQAVGNAARTQVTTLATITAPSGDKCVITKIGGATIQGQATCTSPTSKTTVSPISFKSSGETVLVHFNFGVGDVLCLAALNSTALAISAGSLGTVPVNGIAWSCATPGVTVPINGTAVWP